MATRATNWSTARRAASLACPLAVRATVSTEGSVSTCQMGPAAGEWDRGQGAEAERAVLGNPSWEKILQGVQNGCLQISDGSLCN